MKPFNRNTEMLLGAALPGKSSIFDVGCGHGEIAFWLAENGGHTVYGIDPRLPLPQGHWHSVTDLSSGQVNLMNGVVEGLQPEPRFDCVLALGLLHSLGSRQAVDSMLAHLSLWARPGANLALSWLTSTRSSASRHSEAYYPTNHEVFSALTERGATLKSKWEAEVVHEDRGFHSHNAIYAIWRMV